MARPPKQTVEYFSHDADASEKKTLSILYNHFEHEGISAWWMLLEQLAKHRNHFLVLTNPEDLEFLAAKMHFKPERLRDILVKLADLEAIDAQLFKTGIIWSQHFVERLEPVYKERKQALPSKPQLSIPETQLSIPETQLSIPETPQRKKERKYTKESILKKENKENNQKKYYGEFNNVLLLEQELQKLTDKFGPELPAKIEILSAGIASKGYKYKNHYAALLSWDRREKEQKEQNVRIEKTRGIPGNRPAGAFDDIETK